MRLKRLAQGDMKINGKFDDTYWNKGIRLPNCTLYCLLRLWEQGLEETPLFTYTNGSRNFPNAKLWYNYWRGNKGTAPKVGGVLVWGNSNSKYGHVAICEDILKDNGNSWEVQISASNYGGTYFESKTYTIQKGVSTKGVGMAYIGCCYVDLDLGQSTRNKAKHQAQIEDTNVLSRKGANGDKISGMYSPIGTYNVLDVKEVDGTKWVKIGINDGNEVWCGAYTDLEATEEEIDLTKYIVSRDKTKHQIELTSDIVRARRSASINGDIIAYMPIGIYNVQDEIVADNYTWVKITDGVYFAKVEDCYKEYDAEADYKSLYNAEVKKYKELEKEYNSLNKEYISLKSTNSELTSKITTLENKISKAVNELT